MEAKTFHRFFSKLPLISKDSMDIQHSFFTLHLYEDCSIKVTSLFVFSPINPLFFKHLQQTRNSYETPS